MAANDLFAGVAGWLLREAVGYDLAAPLPSAPPLLRHGTHGGCDWFTGICSVPARETWRNRNRSYCELPSRPASAPPEKRGAMGGDVTARRPRLPRRFGRCGSVGRRRLRRGRAEGAEEL